MKGRPEHGHEQNSGDHADKGVFRRFEIETREHRHAIVIRNSLDSKIKTE
jgi:hypothetical protein